MVGLIVSTGINIEDRMETVSRRRVETEFGEVTYLHGELRGAEVCLLRRTGTKAKVPPHLVNHRANVKALATIGVRSIIATTVVGALAADLTPGTLVVPDQFIDFRRLGPVTVYGAERFRFIDLTQPYCARLRAGLLGACADLPTAAIASGTYVAVDGPRYETAAEVQMFRALGGTVIGMSGTPEAIFARELDLCYGCISVVSNLAAGLGPPTVRIEEVNAVVERRAPVVTDLIELFVSRHSQPIACGCVNGTRWELGD